MADLTTLWTGLMARVSQGLKIQGVLTSSATAASTPASTDETTLWTYTLPENALANAGDRLRVTVLFRTGATANAKTVKLYFGATVLDNIVNAAALNNVQIYEIAELVRVTATTQIAYCRGFTSTFGGDLFRTTPTETLTGPVEIKVTGTNGTAAAGDVVFESASVEVMPAA